MARTSATRSLRLAAILAAGGLLGVLALGTWFRGRLRASLPVLDGSVPLRGLAAPVEVARDGLGVPTVRGLNRADVARATGFVHAQDRFFQMDLLRRRSAGELAELIGPPVVALDRAARIHGFRAVAREVVARAPAESRAVFEAYADGVNAGLAALGERPFEYLVLRELPKRWLPEDSVLVAFAMTLDLEDDKGGYGRTLAAVRDRLGARALAFFAPLSAPDDAALDGSSLPLPAIPPSGDIDLRRAPSTHEGGEAGAVALSWPDPGSSETPGSNCFAVSGAHTRTGSALLANDMHLHLAVPNIWYRASLEWPGNRVTGVMLPGTPLVVAGSNGRIAWGFTNACIAAGDLVVVNASISPDLYHGPGGVLLPFEVRRERIAVRGAGPVDCESRWTRWGPVVATGPNGTLLVYRWTAYDPDATNVELIGLEDASSAAAAVAVAHRAGIPAENFTVADSAGAIAWTIAGRLPHRVGYDGRTPVSLMFGDRRWDGLAPPDSIPVVFSPPGGRLWTANNRPLAGAALALLGDGGYAPGARAAQIRDDLDALLRGGRMAAPRDLLAIQLDDRALFLERWHALLLDVLQPGVVFARPSLATLRRWAGAWEGRASVESVSYGIVRDFRLAVARRVLRPIFAPCVEAYPEFNPSKLNFEPALWTLVHARPLHLLDPAFASWDDLLVAAADDAAAGLAGTASDPAQATWGRRNTTRIVHPFAAALPRWLAPLLAPWLEMPAEPVPGDSAMPRIQDRAYGASERFSVSPGHEAEGIFHMPGGQSGHPLSPYYKAGFEAWVRGDPTPFLPGPTEHTLVLAPGR